MKVVRCLLILLLFTSTVPAQEEEMLIPPGASPGAPLIKINEPENRMRPILERYSIDQYDFDRIYEITISDERFRRLDMFHREWLKSLDQIDFAGLTTAGKVDFILFRNMLKYRIRELELEQQRFAETDGFLPFANRIVSLQEQRRKMEKPEPRAAASELNALQEQVQALHDLKMEVYLENPDELSELLANRSAGYLDILLETLDSWYGYHHGYDPLFTWWCELPYTNLRNTLATYQEWLINEPGGALTRDEREIAGDPVGREALMAELEFSMIPYTPEELIAIGWQEYETSLEEMLKASEELGYDEDWHAALEHVKKLHVEPGEQPELIRELAREAIDFVETNEMMTIPTLAKESWIMEMMTPERQLITPFFTGGPTISVSFPTNTMEHEDKLMSLRGNNRYFSRAVVHHELIPGHHMQYFVNNRYNTHRRPFSTPFWSEGWALWWELYLYKNDFATSPEERIGMLYWRMHRCARIIFSLSFHLGEMNPEECIEFLVEKVGHERANAEAEVRRSFTSYYGPLYQAAYMVGGLQFRALYDELVSSGIMTDRQFHDYIMTQNSLPVEMLRALLIDQDLEKNHTTGWKFYGDVDSENSHDKNDSASQR